jgi:hypothetical protein
MVLAFSAVPAKAVENLPVNSLCGGLDGATGATCMFTGNGGNGAGIPISARTEFPDEFDTAAVNMDPLNTAEHELFHAIGFAIFYNNFDNKLIATPGRGANGIPALSESYSTNGMANGILMVMDPTAALSHADPAATGAGPWPATGYNQNMDIMQPSQVIGTRLNANDAAVLADAFGWNTTGIRINVVNVGNSLDDDDLGIINNAIAAVNAFWPVQANSPVFTWSVAEVLPVPEPSTWATMLLGMGLVSVWIRRRPRTVAA